MLSLLLLIATAFGALVVAWGISRKRSGGLPEWAVGGRSFGAVMVFVLFAGENFTTFTLLGGAGWAYDKGVAAVYSACYAPLACAFSY